MAIDPVCGMTVDPAKARGRETHDGKEYFFCSVGCATKFNAEPARWLKDGPNRKAMSFAGPVLVGIGAIKPATPVVASNSSSDATRKSKYICPMDPEVESDIPGACPKCGMA